MEIATKKPMNKAASQRTAYNRPIIETLRTKQLEFDLNNLQDSKTQISISRKR